MKVTETEFAQNTDYPVGHDFIRPDYLTTTENLI